jgi:hypothetical protein
MVLHQNVFNSEIKKRGHIQFVITQENNLNQMSRTHDDYRTFLKNSDIGLVAMEVRSFKNHDELTEI